MKVNKWDGSAASSEQELLKEWRSYFDLLLNNDNGITPHPSSSRGPDKHWLPISRGDLWSNCSHKNNQGHSFGLCHYCWGTASSNAWCHSRHVLCFEVYTSLSPPRQWITNVVIPLPKKGDLSLMKNCRGISRMSMSTKVYNRILLNGIRPHVGCLLSEASGRDSRVVTRPRQSRRYPANMLSDLDFADDFTPLTEGEVWLPRLWNNAIFIIWRRTVCSRGIASLSPSRTVGRDIPPSTPYCMC